MKVKDNSELLDLESPIPEEEDDDRPEQPVVPVVVDLAHLEKAVANNTVAMAQIAKALGRDQPKPVSYDIDVTARDSEGRIKHFVVTPRYE